MQNGLFIRNLSWSVTEDTLGQLFESAGTVDSVRIPTDRYTGKPRGFAFVTMETDEMAQQAIDQLNGHNLDGRDIVVQYQDKDRSQSRQRHSGGFENDAEESNSIFIQGLPPHTTETDLGEWLSQAGTVESVSIPLDRDTGAVRGFGFIDMGSVSEAKQAIEQLSGQSYQGTSVTLRFKRPDKRRQRAY